MSKKEEYKLWEYGIDFDDNKKDSFKMFLWNKSDDIKYQADIQRLSSPFLISMENFKVFFFNYERDYNSLDERGSLPVYDTLMPTKEEARKNFLLLIDKAGFFIKPRFGMKDFIIIPSEEFLVEKEYFSSEDFTSYINPNVNMILQMEAEKDAAEYAEFANQVFNLLERENEFERQYLILKTFGNVLFQNSNMINFKADYFLKILEKEPEKTMKYFKIYLQCAPLEDIRRFNYTDTFLSIKNKEEAFRKLFEEDAVFHLAFFAGSPEIFDNTKQRIKEKFGLGESDFNKLFKESVNRFFKNTSKFYEKQKISPKKEIIKMMAKINSSENTDTKIDNPLEVYEYFTKEESKNINSLKEYVLKDISLRDFAVKHVLKGEFEKMKENQNKPKGIRWLEK